MGNMNSLNKLSPLLNLTLCFLFFLTGCEKSNHAEVKKEKIGGIDIAYYTRGSGQPLVMIMGFRGTMAIWDPELLNELEKKYTLILFDNRGVGLSSDTEKNLTTIPQMAEDTFDLIKALGYDKVSVLGWSMGSRIAEYLTTTHPEVVENLILCSPNPGGNYQVARKTDAYQKLTSQNISPDEALSLIYPNTSEGREASSSFVRRLTEAITKGSVPDDLKVSDRTIDRQVQAVSRWDKNNENYNSLSNIKVPTLVAGGLADVLDQPENVKIVASRIPFAWTAYFPGAGHAFLSQNAKNFADLVTNFIESNKTASTKGPTNTGS